MTKKYEDMTLNELYLEKQRLVYYINNSKGNYIGFKQNKKSLARVKDLIARKGGTN